MDRVPKGTLFVVINNPKLFCFNMLVLELLGAFVLGALVFRNNPDGGNKIISWFRKVIAAVKAKYFTKKD